MSLPMWKQDGWKAPTEVNYLYLGLGFLVVEQAFEIYLSLRQRKFLKKEHLPKELTEQVGRIDQDDEPQVPVEQVMKREEKTEKKDKEATSLLEQLKEKFHKSQTYNLDKNTFSFFSMAYGVVLGGAMMVGGFSVMLWDLSSQICSNFDVDNEIAISCLFLFGQSIISTITNLPLSIYKTFFLEAKHGFNNTTVGLYISDIFKNLVVESVLILPLMAGIIKLVRWGGEHFWFYVWMLILVFSLVMLTIYPNYIMPLFNKYEPLEEGELKTEIENLAKSVEFPLKKLYMVDGSKRSSHSNAYLFGFWKDKRIVLYDTLIKNEKEPTLECTTGEVVSILAHEIGHNQLYHTLKGFILQNCIYLIGLKGFSLFLHDPDMYASFGFSDKPVVIGLSLFTYIMSPLGAVLGLTLNAMTRVFEFEADAYAVKLGKVEGLKSGLCKISISNLASFDVDPLFHMFHHSHPTLIERLRAMDEQSTLLNKKE